MRDCNTPVSDDDSGTRSLKPVGGERTRLCFLGSTGRGGASACVKKRLLGPSTSTYFVDGRTEATGCGALAGDEGRSASGCCSSISVAIAAAQYHQRKDHGGAHALQSCLGNKIGKTKKERAMRAFYSSFAWFRRSSKHQEGRESLPQRTSHRQQCITVIVASL